MYPLRSLGSIIFSLIWVLPCNLFRNCLGCSGGATVLGKLPVPGHPTIWMTVGQVPIALAVDADGGCLDIFTRLYLFSSLSPCL